MMKKGAIFVLAVLIGVSTGLAVEFEGATFPDTMTVGNETLVLNGTGLRKFPFPAIKIYIGALYLQKKSDNAEAIIAADEPMAVRMHLLAHALRGKQYIKGWNEGFEKTTGDNTGPIQDQIDQFNKCFEDGAKKNDYHDIVYVPGKGVTVYLNGKPLGTMKGLDFKKALFAIWLGKEPPNEELKEGMLGK